MTDKTLKNGLALLVACFPDKDFEPKVYWHLLKDLDDNKFMKAVEDVCKSAKDIYPGTNIIAMIREKATVKPRLTAGEGWECVLNALRACGERDNPKFKDPLVAKAVRCVGWKQLFNSEKIQFERANFMKVYNELADKAGDKEVLSLPSGEVKQIISDVAGRLTPNREEKRK